MNQQKIGAFIRILRTEQGITQTEFAKRINVSQTTVSKWESGTSLPDPANVEIIIKFFQISIGEFYNGERQAQSCLFKKLFPKKKS